MIQSVLKIGNPLLLKQSDPVLPHEFNSDELKKLIDDLYDTMVSEQGLGIAAPQIGVLKQVVIIEYSADNERYKNLESSTPLTIIINPKLTPIGDESSIFVEGCLSVPKYKGEVERPKFIYYEYYDFEGNKVSGEDDGMFSRVLQHECDHLQGILYPMRMKDMSKFSFIEN
jgi:peptide deformylase